MPLPGPRQSESSRGAELRARAGEIWRRGTSGRIPGPAQVAVCGEYSVSANKFVRDEFINLLVYQVSRIAINKKNISKPLKLHPEIMPIIMNIICPMN